MTDELALAEPEMLTEIAPAQMELLIGESVPVDKSKPEFSYTTERLWRDRPDIAKAALKLLAEPREAVSYRSIRSRLHISYHTLRALERESGETIAQTKQTLANISASVTMAAAEKTMELVPNLKNAKDAAITYGIFAEKTLLFAGEATGRIEIAAKIDFRAAVKDLYEEATKKFAEMKTAQVIEVPVPALEDAACSK